MPKALFTNNAVTTLSGTLPQGGTAFAVATGGGNKFPSPTAGNFAYVTLYQKDVGGNEINVEIVKLTGRTQDTFQVVRDVTGMTGQSGGYAYPGSAGQVYVELRWVAGDADLMLQADDNLAALTNKATARANLGLGSAALVAAPAGAVVGDTDAQTLQNKTINLGSNTLAGTLAQFNAACSDADFASTADVAGKVAKTSDTGAAVLPKGTTAQRDASPQAGYMRWNLDLGRAEAYDGSAWSPIGGGGQMLGNATIKAVSYNSQTISENLTIAAGTNGLSAGPLSIANGFSVTVADGSAWVIV